MGLIIAHPSPLNELILSSVCRDLVVIRVEGDRGYVARILRRVSGAVVGDVKEIAVVLDEEESRDRIPRNGGQVHDGGVAPFAR